MNENYVITVGRQYGSGGRELGMMLSHMLGIGYYDKRLITEAAKRSGLADETFEQQEDRKFGPLWYALSSGFNFGGAGFAPEDIFRIQSETIRDIAAHESCVVVGRCADYVLRENPRCVNIFVHAPLDDRKRRVAVRRHISFDEAGSVITKTDKSRASYYNFYTEKVWGFSTSYDLCVDSSLLGLEDTARMVVEFVERVLAARTASEGEKQG